MPVQHGRLLIFLSDIQGGSNMTGTDSACLHTNQSRSYLNHLVSSQFIYLQLRMFRVHGAV